MLHVCIDATAHSTRDKTNLRPTRHAYHVPCCTMYIISCFIMLDLNHHRRRPLTHRPTKFFHHHLPTMNYQNNSLGRFFLFFKNALVSLVLPSSYLRSAPITRKEEEQDAKRTTKYPKIYKIYRNHTSHHPK